MGWKCRERGLTRRRCRMNASGGERAQEGEGTASILLPRNDPNQVAGFRAEQHKL